MGLGDDVMALGRAVRIHANYGRKVLIGPRGAPYTSPMFKHAPCLVNANEPEMGCERLLDYPGHRPYIDYGKCTANRQALHADFRAKSGALFFSERENAITSQWLEDHAIESGFILVEPHVKEIFSGANKLWPWGHWEGLVAALRGRGRIVVQASRPGERLLKLVSAAIRHEDVRRALALMRHAICVVTTDGLFHHAAAALHVPAVVIWGARTNPKILRYERHMNLTDGDDWCGSMKNVCQHCQAAMSRILPGRVWHAVEHTICGTPVK